MEQIVVRIRLVVAVDILDVGVVVVVVETMAAVAAALLSRFRREIIRVPRQIAIEIVFMTVMTMMMTTTTKTPFCH